MSPRAASLTIVFGVFGWILIILVAFAVLGCSEKEEFDYVGILEVLDDRYMEEYATVLLDCGKGVNLSYWEVQSGVSTKHLLIDAGCKPITKL